MWIINDAQLIVPCVIILGTPTESASITLTVETIRGEVKDGFQGEVDAPEDLGVGELTEVDQVGDEEETTVATTKEPTPSHEVEDAEEVEVEVEVEAEVAVEA